MRKCLSLLVGGAAVTGLALCVMTVTAGAAGATVVPTAVRQSAAAVAPRADHASTSRAAAFPGETWIQETAWPGYSITFSEIRDVNTHRCLDDSFTYHLRPYSCGGNCPSCQEWTLSYQSDGTWTMKNANTRGCVDDSFTYHLRSYPCGGNCPSCQHWYEYGVYNSSNGNFLWDTFVNENTDGCIDDSARYGLRSYPCNGLNYQGWIESG